MRRILEFVLTAAFGATLAVGFCYADAPQSAPTGLAVYLPRDSKITIEEAKLTDLTNIELMAEPLISPTEIVEYNWSTHVFKVTAAALERVESYGVSLDRSVTGPFVVVVGKDPVYLGTFWSPISSLTPSVPSILSPFGSRVLMISKANSATVDSLDVRNDARILEALRRAGTLVE